MSSMLLCLGKTLGGVLGPPSATGLGPSSPAGLGVSPGVVAGVSCEQRTPHHHQPLLMCALRPVAYAPQQRPLAFQPAGLTQLLACLHDGFAGCCCLACIIINPAARAPVAQALLANPMFSSTPLTAGSSDVPPCPRLLYTTAL